MASLKFPPKEDYPALLPGGVHRVDIEALKLLAVNPFPDDNRRAMHFDSFCVWYRALLASRVSCKIWVCGSFMTSKPEPRDIDVVLWGPRAPFVSTEDLSHILHPREALRTFCMDLTVEPFHQDLTFFREAHHLGFHGFANDRRTPRGIAELVLD